MGRIRSEDVFKPGSKVMFRPEDVFKPTGYPTETYVSRKEGGSAKAEQQMTDALSRSGVLISLIGPSKSGKTVLAQHVLGDRLLKVSGSRIKEVEDLWTEAAKNLELSAKSTIAVASSADQEEETGVSGSASLWGVIAAIVNFRKKFGKRKSITGTRESHGFSTQDLIDCVKQSHKVLVIEDYHYIPKATQARLSHQLKDFVDDTHAIAISIPHRAEDPVRSNRDLVGRIETIDIGYWTEMDLAEIGKGGFQKLSINLSGDELSRLVQHAYSSPQLMQTLCLAYSRMVLTDKAPTPFSEPLFATLLSKVLATIPLEGVVRKIQSGPPTRGRERTLYRLKNGDEVDNYGLVIHAIAAEPPKMVFTKSDIRLRISNALAPGVQNPQPNQITQTLARISEIAQQDWEEGPPHGHRVLEYHDDVLHILDPYLMFYLRGSAASKRKPPA